MSSVSEVKPQRWSIELALGLGRVVSILGVLGAGVATGQVKGASEKGDLPPLGSSAFCWACAIGASPNIWLIMEA